VQDYFIIKQFTRPVNQKTKKFWAQDIMTKVVPALILVTGDDKGGACLDSSYWGF
jgi:hypothetical protein